MRSFVKLKSSRNGGITLSYTDEGNSVIVTNFYVANRSFNTICEKQILPKTSEFTVFDNEYLVRKKGLKE